MFSLLLQDGDISPDLGPTTNILRNMPTSFKQRQKKNTSPKFHSQNRIHTPCKHILPTHSINAPLHTLTLKNCHTNSTLITLKQPPHCPPHFYLIVSISLFIATMQLFFFKWVSAKKPNYTTVSQGHALKLKEFSPHNITNPILAPYAHIKEIT